MYLILTTDHSAATHQPYPSAQYEPYDSQPQTQQHYQDSGFNPETYNNTALLAAAGIAPHPTDHYPPPASQHERNYTLGGGNYDSGYGANQVPDHSQHNNNQYFQSTYQIPSHPSSPPQLSSSPAPINTNVPAMPTPGPETATSPVRGPRSMGSPVHQYSDNPPSYDTGPSQPLGAWGTK
jgi:hypothetical protein